MMIRNAGPDIAEQGFFVGFSFEPVEYMVPGEAEHPGADAFDLVQALALGPDLHEDILHHVFGNEFRLGEMVREGEDKIPVLVK